FFYLIHPAPTPPLFPYTTLFRSQHLRVSRAHRALMDPGTSTSRVTIERVIETLRDKPGALMPILHGIQDALGFIPPDAVPLIAEDRKSTRLNSSHVKISYAVFCL